MIVVALGANLPGPSGGPADQLFAALTAIELTIGHVVRCSQFYRSAPYPPSDQPDYVNAVAVIETALDPAALLAALHAIEARLGRRRTTANAARAIDLDLIDYDGILRADPPPVLPHPRMAGRGFVLQPLAEVAPGWCHPRTGASVSAMLADVPADGRAEPTGVRWARGNRGDRV